MILKPDKSGETYDIVIDAWLNGYKEYKVIPYTFTVREDNLNVNIEGITDAVLTLTIDDNFNSVITDDTARQTFENNFANDISNILGIDVNRIVIL